MIREEAINLINQEIHDTKIQGKKYAFLKKSCDKKCEALEMAIKALEAPPNDNWEGYSSRLWKSAYERGKVDAKAEQTSALDKAIAEIAAYGSIWVEYSIHGHTDHDIEVIVENVLKQAKEQVLAVIDKYRESEDK